MNPEQQAFLLSNLEASRAALERAVSACTEPEWSTKASPESWSVSECSDHIVTTESLILLRIGKLPEIPEETYSEAESVQKDQIILQIAERTGKAEAPAPTKPASRFASNEEMLAAFHSTRERYLLLVQDNPAWLRGRFLNHPMLKKLDGYQWILSASCHTLRHVAQIEEVRQQLANEKLLADRV